MGQLPETTVAVPVSVPATVITELVEIEREIEVAVLVIEVAVIVELVATITTIETHES